MTRTGEITVTYQGIDLDINYRFIKGTGSQGRLDPPDEDTVDLLKVEACNELDLPFDPEELGTKWDLEMMVMEKIRN